MIHLALEVLAFLFLCWVGLIVLGIVAAIFGAITDATGKLFAPYRPPSSKTPSSKTPFALGHERDHDARTCPQCLGGGHRNDPDLYARAPRGMSTDELHRWAAQERERETVPEQEREKRQIEAVPQYKTHSRSPMGRPYPPTPKSRLLKNWSKHEKP